MLIVGVLYDESLALLEERLAHLIEPRFRQPLDRYFRLQPLDLSFRNPRHKAASFGKPVKSPSIRFQEPY